MKTVSGAHVTVSSASKTGQRIYGFVCKHINGFDKMMRRKESVGSLI